MKEKSKFTRNKLLLIVILFLGVGNYLSAQERELKGVVFDQNTEEPLPGATVLIAGTSIGVTTNLDGEFSVNVEDGQKIQVSFIGYISEEIEVTGQTDLTVHLVPDLTELSEVVVIGYGVQKKIEMTGAVSSVKSEDMAGVVASDFTKSLQGQVAGVSVIESSGRPGDQANIQIRGLGSITSNASPLYVVDGIPYDNNPNIASEDIASVEILKDGAAAAIYGTRASNGVILITTKRGEAGKTKVSLSAYYGIQNITSGTPLMGTPEHIYVDEMKSRAEGGHSNIFVYNPDAMNYNTDFVDYIQNNNAPIQSYNLSISGGQDNLTFLVNSNYYKQDGVIIKSGYERFSTRANTTFKKGKFDALVNMGVNISQKEEEPWALYEYAIFQGPYRPSVDELETDGSSTTIPGNNPDHLSYFTQLLNNEDFKNDNSFNLSANLKYEFFEGFKYQMNLGMNYWNYQRNFWEPQYLVYDEVGELNDLGSRKYANLLEEFHYTQKYTWENILSYDKSFGDHNLSVLALYSMEQGKRKEVSAEKRDFIRNDINVFDAGSEMVGVNGSNRTNGLVGSMLRVQYNYQSKYLFSASVRRDGSSKFGEDKRYAVFPGVSVGWNMNEEAFLSGVNTIDNLKIRASYAEVGNEGIDPYLYAGYIDANIDYIYGSETTLSKGAIQRGYENSDVSWEANVSRNIGVDLLMLRGRVGANIDLYQNNKNDMLLNVLLPASTGTNVPNDWAGKYNSKISNVGDMVNKGIELSAFYKQLSQSGLGWKITGVFTQNKNEILSLGDLETIPLTDSKPGLWRADFLDNTTYMVPGYEAGAFFLIPTDGVIKTEEELAEVNTYMPNARIGDLKYIDQVTVDTDGDGVADAKDGVINDDDRVYQGSGIPKFEAGLKFDLTYRGFDFNLHLVYMYGNKVFNGSKLFAYGFARHQDMYYAWTPANTDSNVPAARSNSEHDNFRSRSDFFLEDGSFLRLRNISIGYTFPKEWFNDKVQNMRVYASGQNLWTLTDYEGYDPEVGGNGVSTRGIDKGNYPVSRNITFGLQLDF